jgi:thiamine biosynthesis lipoprotein
MQIVVIDPGMLSIARREVDAELDRIEVAVSRFRPDSEINVLASRGGRPTRVSEVAADLLEAALDAAQLTDGDVDPTVGGAIVALGYDRDFAGLDDAQPPAVTMTVPARWSMVTVRGRVVTVPPGIVLDLGATAKAVAADRCAQRVHRACGCGVLINLGGDIATAGAAPDGGWQVLVQDDDEDPASSVGLGSGAALATSSTVHRRWQRGDKWFHHVLDPRTGLPAEPVWRTVSVVAQSCFAANTVSTAAVVRGRRALDWIQSLGMSARLVAGDRSVYRVGDWPAPEAVDDR